jgi:hypothetical protein
MSWKSGAMALNKKSMVVCWSCESVGCVREAESEINNCWRGAVVCVKKMFCWGMKNLLQTRPLTQIWQATLRGSLIHQLLRLREFLITWNLTLPSIAYEMWHWTSSCVFTRHQQNTWHSRQHCPFRKSNESCPWIQVCYHLANLLFCIDSRNALCLGRATWSKRDPQLCQL